MFWKVVFKMKMLLFVIEGLLEKDSILMLVFVMVRFIVLVGVEWIGFRMILVLFLIV